jgi:hypothetical protein
LGEEEEYLVAVDLEVTSTRRKGVKPFTRRVKTNPRRGRFWLTTYRLGSANQASDYELVSQFIINHVWKEFTNGDDIGDALEDKREVNLDAHRPSITMSQAQDAVTRDKEDQEN